MPGIINDTECLCEKIGRCCAYCYKKYRANGYKWPQDDRRISDGHGCTNRATIADRDLTAERLADHREARMGGWE
jgi:hypothetical protein